MKVQEQLVHLVRLQELADRACDAQRVVDGAAARIEEIEQRFRERNAEYVAIKERFDALEGDRVQRTTELAELEQDQKKFQQDLMQVQNQREYAAILREIDTVKSHIAEHEEAILIDMEQLETVTTELASHESHIEEERGKVAAERHQVEAEVATAEKAIEQTATERSGIEVGLPAGVVALARRVESSRQGHFMAIADEGVCKACFVRIRPQAFQEIRQAIKIHSCGNCKRLLFTPASVAPPAPVESAENTGAIKTTDGGTV